MWLILSIVLVVLFGLLIFLAPTGEKDNFDGHCNIYDRCDWGGVKNEDN
jgi:uncharacterized protein YjeT (DUF2065 family)